MKGRKKGFFIACYLAPALVWYLGLVVWPLVQALMFSFTRWRGLSMNRTFVGGENFSKLVQDPVFWQAARNNLTVLIFGGISIVVLALLLAHATQGKGRTAKTLRSLYLFPQVVSLVAVAVMWQFVFNPKGLLNSGLERVGLSAWQHTWLGESGTALGSVTVAFVWTTLGFYIMLFGAGLAGIPAEVTEASALDGSSGWHRFRHVTWPMLFASKRIAAIYLLINVMNIFALPYLMTRGGPDRKSEAMLTYLYEQAFVNSQFGYATALAVANFVFVMGASLVILWLFRRDPTARQA